MNDKISFRFNSPGIEQLVGTPLDSADYIALKYGTAKSSNSNSKSVVIGVIEEKSGNKFSVTINGAPALTDYKGKEVNTPVSYESYITSGRVSELSSDTSAYIQIAGEREGKKFIGVFYSLADMIQWFEENEKKKTEVEFASC